MPPKQPPQESAFDKYLYRIVLTLAGSSLGINSYMIRERIGEVLDAIKSLKVSVSRLEIESAVQHSAIDTDTKMAIDHERRLEIAEEDLAGLRAIQGQKYRSGRPR